MKTRLLSTLIVLAICICGCTGVALRRSTFNQSKTVSDFLADQVLYNLALYKDYYDGDRVNGLPSFVKLATGQSQVQQAINAQMALKIADAGTVEKDPQLTGNHQTQDNWSFIPVVDPNEISRLYWLYRAEFNAVDDAALAKIFPPSPPALDQQGRPYLDYTPETYTNGFVILTNNQPVFKAKPKRPIKPTIADIPGAVLNDRGDVNGGWFSFSQPANAPLSARMGPYLNHYIWITNRENFFKFALLALGGTNSTAALKSSPAIFLLNNGVATDRK